MKTLKLLILTAVVALLSNVAGAQIAMPVTTASYSNTGADTASIRSTTGSISAIQPVITKISGTVAGKAFLWVSVDGANYVKQTTDSLVLTNQTINTKIFVVNPAVYPYYRVIVTGTGTMAASFKSWYYGKQ